MEVMSWVVHTPREPMVLEGREETPGPGEVLVEVAGCGVCHTDLGFFHGDVPTRRPLPLTLGHEVSGTVVEAGDGAGDWKGKTVVVPAVIPCGKCDACKEGRGSICPKQIFPGNDIHGGFGTHLCVPADGLCPVPDLGDASANPAGVDLETLAVLADAVSTPYQAVRRSGLVEGDLAVWVGVGGVGGFGVQIAAALGAVVVAIDVDQGRLDQAAGHGAVLTLRADELDFKSMRKAVRGLAKERGIPTWHHRIYETSGTPQGQGTAFGLMGHGAYLSVVGFTPAKTELRFSNLMALDAKAEGNWGCLPALYPEALDMLLKGKVALGPYTEKRPLAGINEAFADVAEHRASRRIILVPEG